MMMGSRWRFVKDDVLDFVQRRWRMCSQSPRFLCFLWDGRHQTPKRVSNPWPIPKWPPQLKKRGDQIVWGGSIEPASAGCRTAMIFFEVLLFLVAKNAFHFKSISVHLTRCSYFTFNSVHSLVCCTRYMKNTSKTDFTTANSDPLIGFVLLLTKFIHLDRFLAKFTTPQSF